MGAQPAKRGPPPEAAFHDTEDDVEIKRKDRKREVEKGAIDSPNFGPAEFTSPKEYGAVGFTYGEKPSVSVQDVLVFDVVYMPSSGSSKFGDASMKLLVQALTIASGHIGDSRLPAYVWRDAPQDTLVNKKVKVRFENTDEEMDLDRFKSVNMMSESSQGGKHWWK